MIKEPYTDREFLLENELEYYKKLGEILMKINKISDATQHSMKVRIITGILMAVVGIPLIILGDWFFIALALFIGVIGIWEILHVTNKQYSWLIVLIIYIFTLSFIF